MSSAREMAAAHLLWLGWSNKRLVREGGGGKGSGRGKKGVWCLQRPSKDSGEGKHAQQTHSHILFCFVSPLTATLEKIKRSDSSSWPGKGKAQAQSKRR